MRLLLALPAAVLLSACVSPRDACTAEATADLRTIDALIAETEGNLRRGFGIEEDQEVRVRRDLCEGETDAGESYRYVCDRTDVVDVERPVALDLRAEEAKLDSLLERRASLERGLQGRLQACQALSDEV